MPNQALLQEILIERDYENWNNYKSTQEMLGKAVIIKNLEIQNKWFHNHNFSNVIFIDCHIYNVVFYNCNLKNTTFENCVLNDHKTNYSDSISYTVIFNVCNMSYTIFRGCFISDIDFKYSNLDNMILHRTILNRAITVNGCKNVGDTFNGKNNTQWYELFDERGYVTIYDTVTKVIYSGCRVYSPQQALLHWGDKLRYHNRERGDLYVNFANKIIEKIERKER